jgi:hypothetical protein
LAHIAKGAASVAPFTLLGIMLSIITARCKKSSGWTALQLGPNDLCLLIANFEELPTEAALNFAIWQRGDDVDRPRQYFIDLGNSRFCIRHFAPQS